MTSPFAAHDALPPRAPVRSAALEGPIPARRDPTPRTLLMTAISQSEISIANLRAEFAGQLIGPANADDTSPRWRRPTSWPGSCSRRVERSPDVPMSEAAAPLRSADHAQLRVPAADERHHRSSSLTNLPLAPVVLGGSATVVPISALSRRAWPHAGLTLILATTERRRRRCGGQMRLPHTEYEITSVSTNQHEKREP